MYTYRHMHSFSRHDSSYLGCLPLLRFAGFASFFGFPYFSFLPLRFLFGLLIIKFLFLAGTCKMFVRPFS